MESEIQVALPALQLIQPLIALVGWSMVMWTWMYATRLPAVSAMNIKLDPSAPSGSQMAQLPASVRWKADNYNHLMEQPTLFYALVLGLSVLGGFSDFAVYAAWSYVALRIVHSIFQAVFNIIEVRFLLFVLSNIPLLFLLYEAARIAF